MTLSDLVLKVTLGLVELERRMSLCPRRTTGDEESAPG